MTTLACAVVVAVLTAGGPAGITPATVQAIDAWVQAVHAHVPGKPDASVAAVRRMTYLTRADMNTGIDFFVLVLSGKPYNTNGNRFAEQVANIAHGAGMPDAASFLERAAVLHTDAVIFAGLFPQPEDRTAPSPAPAGQRSRRGAGSSLIRTPTPRVPPLLTNATLVQYKDGDVLGTTSVEWNWPFARSLVDELIALRSGPMSVSPQAPDPFIGEWYHAVASYFFANRLYGDATDHFSQAAVVLRDDPRLLFDRGCEAELFGLPEHQVFVSDATAFRPNVPALGETNREAERLFRRALELDPWFVEARVHLARLLDVRGAHAEAAAALATALDSKPTGVVAFYARLFAARNAQQRNALDEAAAQYRDALALFPNAQSALLGLSQAALAAGDTRSTLQTLERLGPDSARNDADPWWDYALASGRDVNELMHHVWASVSR